MEEKQLAQFFPTKASQKVNKRVVHVKHPPLISLLKNRATVQFKDL